MIDACDLAPVTPINPELAPVRVLISAPPPADSPEICSDIERRWAELHTANPRCFDGPILAIERFDPATNTVHARRDGYKRLAVQPQVETGVRILSVTGVLTALDGRGRACALLAQRSPQTRVFGGLWELAPSGGIDPPGGATAMELGEIRSQLGKELREELGLELDVSRARPIALCADEAGRSVDIVLRLDTGSAIDALDIGADRAWEYTGVRWIELGKASAFAREHADELIPSARDLLRVLSSVTEV